ncbi:hypothetical protein GUITHDRAFT_75342 [Guillardia theta CCMP2712]|uniref:Cyclin N-terminal domain-containing protein n=1 Tax=Guillardia theta (strain CCMP2712) TaxID=905079 RepID=L1IXW9_GUITC|nr:hypothetical protein GUITHDRAFT_75342 [Guillardia theta CCMP2712]EKX40680.1 hypothetical protein GUITHDRAFT_75342 [Guillardia theta CCMP2712]|eukprot:XP_005827660.1 hypothetical protein GUITHDRAFT_75342 [Guillardia theta CCMP2712]
MVNHVSNLTNYLNLSGLFVHISTLYMDRFFSKMPVSETSWRIYASACLLLAMKMEGPATAGTPTDLVEFMVDEYELTIEHVKIAELQILKVLEWSLTSPTMLHFMDVYKVGGIYFSDDLKMTKGVPTHLDNQDRICVWEYVSFFCDLAIQKQEFMSCKNSLKTAAAIAASRACLNVTPLWNERLARMTHYNMSEIFECFYRLLQIFREQYPNNFPVGISSLLEDFGMPL